jgi:Ca2+-binding RTX toxin-like protein
MPGGDKYKPSKSGAAELNSTVSFELSTLDENLNSTTFDDAIKNFTASFKQQVRQELHLFNFPDESGASVTLDNPQTLDLQARFVSAGPLTGFDGNPIEGSELDFNAPPKDPAPLMADTDRIEYRLDGGQLSSSGIDELTIFIKDEDPKERFQVAGKDIIVNSATTDVEYIVEQLLLESADNFRISAEYSQDSQRIVSTERPFDLTDESAPIDPVPVNDSANTNENTPVSINVLVNDNAGLIDTFDASTASGGSVTLDGNSLNYTPATDFTGQDTFTYTTDNLGKKSAAAATVTVDVTEGGTTNPPTDPTDPTDPSLDGDDVLTGDNGDNTLNGGEGNNVLRGLDGFDVLTTGAGSDNLDGGNGDDRLSSGGGNDILTGGAGADNIDGGDGNDTIDGGDGNDSILGGGGDDLLRGGNGDDIINGGAGLDVLVGDGGADVFAVNTLGGADVIRDFNYGQDLIGLSDGITFDDLIVTQGDGAAILSFQDQAIASISGGTPSQVNASLFTTI